MKEIIEYFKERIASIKKYNEPMNSASWGYKEGCLISGDKAQKIIDFYERHKDESEQPNAPDITPEWDKIPEGFIFVSIDKNGEEHAYSKEPFPDDRQWRGGWHWNKTGRKFDMTIIDWKQTLSKRPAKQ